MRVDLEKCNGCGFCVRDCPLGAVRLLKKKAVIDESCSDCGACVRVCEQAAMIPDPKPPETAVECDACPIKCWIKAGFTGACHRYKNMNGKLTRITPILQYADVADQVGPESDESIRRPLITAIGSGTTYPDCKPAPQIVKGKYKNIDVVTVTTEAPLSYSSIMVKVDTDIPIGEEGAPVLVGKRKVGMVITEQYGSKMLSVGGVNLMTGKDGFAVARMITDIANKKPVKLKVENGSRLVLQVGHPPVIDGQTPQKMRVGCGSATMGLFAPLLVESADEVIVLDSHITSLMSEHVAGQFAGSQPSGIKLKFKKSTPGRYFGDHGKGWGGTSIIKPQDVIAEIDSKTARAGMRIMITETTGNKAVLFELDDNWHLKEIPLTENVIKAKEAISNSCEQALVSAIYMGGAGGSARAGVSRYPIKLTQAVHAAKANLTVGGAPTYVLPGGGINFMVDVGRVKTGFFYWTPTPATICPIEYTIKLEDYEAMGGHLEAMKPFHADHPSSLME